MNKNPKTQFLESIVAYYDTLMKYNPCDPESKIWFTSNAKRFMLRCTGYYNLLCADDCVTLDHLIASLEAEVGMSVDAILDQVTFPESEPTDPPPITPQVRGDSITGTTQTQITFMKDEYEDRMVEFNKTNKSSYYFEQWQQAKYKETYYINTESQYCMYYNKGEVK